MCNSCENRSGTSAFLRVGLFGFCFRPFHLFERFINLRFAGVGVAKHHLFALVPREALDRSGVGPSLRQVRDRRMSHRMRRDPGRVQFGPFTRDIGSQWFGARYIDTEPSG